MQDRPLTLTHFFDRAERLFAHKEIVTATNTGVERTTYGSWAERTRRLGGVLDGLGISADGRVATFAWNTARHVELYYAPPLTGRVAAHPEHPPVPRAAHVHREPRRGRGGLRGPQPGGAALAARRPVRHRPPHRGDGRRRRRGARRPPPARLRGAARCRHRHRVALRRRVRRRRRCATRAAPPANRRASSTATGRRSCTPWACSAPTAWASASATWSCPSCRCSTPTRGASCTLRWRRGPRSCSPVPTCSPSRWPTSSRPSGSR